MGYIKYAENKENKKTEESIKYEDIYESPIGKIFISCNETGLTEVSFVKEDILADRKNTANAENIESIKKNISILTDTKRWLDIYFSGKEPGFVPSFHVSGTPFQLGVWKILQKIPYAKTVTYGEIAKEIAKEKGISRMSAQAVGGAVGSNKKGISRMSAQAVGGAVGSNKIGIIIPCHRVVGANGNLTGYAGGIYNKEALLRLEGVDMSGMYIQQ